MNLHYWKSTVAKNVLLVWYFIVQHLPSKLKHRSDVKYISPYAGFKLNDGVAKALADEMASSSYRQWWKQQCDRMTNENPRNSS